MYPYPLLSPFPHLNITVSPVVKIYKCKDHSHLTTILLSSQDWLSINLLVAKYQVSYELCQYPCGVVDIYDSRTEANKWLRGASGE